MASKGLEGLCKVSITSSSANLVLPMATGIDVPTSNCLLTATVTQFPSVISHSLDVVQHETPSMDVFTITISTWHCRVSLQKPW